MYSPETMLHGIAPSLIPGLAIAAIAGAAYGLGAPAWSVYLGIVIGLLAALPGVPHWERVQDERRQRRAH
jgi:hypothetical protein